MNRIIFSVLASLGVLLGLSVAPASADAQPRNTVCDGTLEAGTFKNVRVAPGADCIVGPEVTITRNFFAVKSPGVINVNTDIGRNFIVAGAADSVTFGPEGCRVDPHVGNNLIVRNSNNVAICEATVDNNIMLRENTGRLMLRDSVACNNIKVVSNDLQGLRVLRNVHAVNFTVARNDVQNTTRVDGNTKFDGSPQECRTSIKPAA